MLGLFVLVTTYSLTIYEQRPSLAYSSLNSWYPQKKATRTTTVTTRQIMEQDISKQLKTEFEK